MKSILSHFVVAALAGSAAWYFASQAPAFPSGESGGRKLLFYQSPMHPWVKSDKPGRCTVCGMELVPVYEGEAGSSAAAGDATLVLLPPGSPSVANVQTTDIRRQPLVRTLRVAGLLDDDDSRHRILSAYSKGRIEELFVNYEGAEVKKGQPLAKFYSQDLLSAGREYKLAAQQGGAPFIQGARTKLIQLGLTDEQIAVIPQRADDDIYFDVVAPLGGTVVTRHAYAGQYVAEGDPLFEIGDFSTMWFQFIAYEQDLPYLRVGQEVEIHSAALPGKTLRAQVKFINPNIDDMTRTARVRVEVDNKDRSLRHKLYGEAVVKLDAPEVLTVPRQAVLWSGRKPRAYVEKADGAYEARKIQLGRSGDAYWEVLEGLKEGDRVVLSGNMLIDSQAQLESLATNTPEPEPRADAPLADAKRQEWLAYFKAVSALNAALANDDLKAANAALGKLPTAPDPELPAPPKAAEDLSKLRHEFLPWSEAVSAFALKMKPQLPEVMVFRCPMTKDLWSGAPRNAKWVQMEAELRNPYWGREMQDCGAEVKAPTEEKP